VISLEQSNQQQAERHAQEMATMQATAENKRVSVVIQKGAVWVSVVLGAIIAVSQGFASLMDWLSHYFK
jgi:hypothetical protein